MMFALNSLNDASGWSLAGCLGTRKAWLALNEGLVPPKSGETKELISSCLPVNPMVVQECYVNGQTASEYQPGGDRNKDSCLRKHANVY